MGHTSRSYSTVALPHDNPELLQKLEAILDSTELKFFTTIQVSIQDPHLRLSPIDKPLETVESSRIVLWLPDSPNLQIWRVEISKSSSLISDCRLVSPQSLDWTDRQEASIVLTQWAAPIDLPAPLLR